MVWWATIFCSVLGLVFYGWFGVIIGAIIGLYIDINFLAYGHLQSISFHPRFRGFVKYHFVKATFLVMGHIAKLEGVVTPQHIQFAEQMMERMQLNASLRLLAKQSFNAGKRKSFSLNRCLINFIRVCGGEDELLELFVEIQLQAVKLSGSMSTRGKRVIMNICQVLQFGVIESQNSAHYFHERHDKTYSHQHYDAYQPQRSDTHKYFAMLGVDRKASLVEIKKRYRQLISKHHPDRVIARGGSPQEIQQATEKTQEIHGAYEEILRIKGGA
jgi:DnaJ like chaperone protein